MKPVVLVMVARTEKELGFWSFRLGQSNVGVIGEQVRQKSRTATLASDDYCVAMLTHRSQHVR